MTSIRRDHSKKLLEEACSNRAYPIRHKLKDCGIMRSFMTSRFLTWGAELDECLDGSDMTPFPEKTSSLWSLEDAPTGEAQHV
jgi:hypothetical protein